MSIITKARGFLLGEKTAAPSFSKQLSLPQYVKSAMRLQIWHLWTCAKVQEVRAPYINKLNKLRKRYGNINKYWIEEEDREDLQREIIAGKVNHRRMC
jgi:hypothetical protein